MKKKTQILIAAVIMVAVIVLSIFVYVFIYREEKKEEEIVEAPKISITPLITKTYEELKQEGWLDKIDIVDDRISPLTTQAVSLEVNRIRKKGIEVQMRKIGGWFNRVPSYHYEAVIHDGFWKSRQINKWDTDYVGWEAFRKVDEKLEKCTIEFKLYDTQKKLFKTVDVEKDSFTIVYDTRTGRWTGDDCYGDENGYGYFNGDTFEVWFDVHQSDYDGDGIPYWVEVNILGTDPTVDDRYLDPDKDGVTTDWEWKWGYDPFTWDDHEKLDPDVDGIENIEEYGLREYLANPYRKDIYVEVDFMEKEPGIFGDEHMLWEESQQMVMDKFSEQGIALHIDDGCMGGGGEYFEFYEKYIPQEGGIVSEYYKYHFADERKGVFRYCVVVHFAGWCHPQDYKLDYDVMAIPCNREVYRSFTPPAILPRQKRIATACAFMHELGHTLGLRYETNHGIDNATYMGRGMEDVPLIKRIQQMYEMAKYWKNYRSCMNYFMLGTYVLGYSDGTHGEHDVDDWSMIDLTYFQRHEPLGVEGLEPKK